MADSKPPLSGRDRFIIGFLAFCFLIAVTLELYWLIFRAHMLERHDLFARLLAIYWPADRTYRDPIMDNAQAFTFAVESVNVVLQTLGVLLIYAVWKKRPYRYPLQLFVATYAGYGTVLYYYVAQLSGYNVMADHSTGTFLLFYLVNLPWLLGHGFLACDAIVAISRRFRAPLGVP